MITANLSFMQRLRLRENHIFFALTIIIGILSGLAAVLVHSGNQRYDVSTLRNSSFQPPLHPGSHVDESGYGVFAGKVFPGGSRQRGPADRSGLSPQSGRSSVSGRVRKVSDRCALHRIGPLDGKGRPFGPDRSRHCLSDRQMVSSLACPRAKPRSRRRGCGAYRPRSILLSPR